MVTFVCFLFSQLPQTNTTLTSLNLRDNQIGAAGATALATALQTNTTLTALNLWSNEIGAAGATALATALQTNKTLTSLHLGRMFCSLADCRAQFVLAGRKWNLSGKFSGTLMPHELVWLAVVLADPLVWLIPV
jgi:hypothetical protein